jgi:hypothetical protein
LRGFLTATNQPQTKQTIIIMSKLRSDSVFNQLTPEQADSLEGWLFEEGISYKEARERVQKEFNLTTSLSGLRRFYQRLAGERSKESLTDMITVCVEAMGAAQPGVLAGGYLTLALKCAVELLTQSPGIKELTGLMRVMTSAQALEMKRIVFQREEAALKRRVKEWEEEQVKKREQEQRIEEINEACRKAREEKRKAKAVAAEAAKGGAGNIVALDEGRGERSQTAATGEGTAGEMVPTPDAPDIDGAKEAVKPLNAA